jgi:hypothetical protein
MATLGSVAVLCLGVAMGAGEHEMPPPGVPPATVATADVGQDQALPERQHFAGALDLPPGTRLRVAAAGWDKPVVGTLAGEREGRLWLRAGRQSELISVPWDDVRRVEQPRGRRRHPLGGAAKGLGLGVGSALVLHAAACSTSECDGVTVWELSAMGAVFGAAVGLVVGALVQTDVWEPVTTSRLRVGLAVGPRGPALSLRF